PIGRPIANTRLYVLDASLRPVPIGVPGELYIAGRCLARGYVGDPELTAARFLEAAPAGTPERLYRTGDRARHDDHGELEFLGRLDDQVKIRGHRVEPHEIDEALRAIATVRAAATVHRELGTGARGLVSFVVPRPGAPVAPGPGWIEALRAELGRRLPPYMLPAVIAELPELPLTAHGKVDRAALLARRLPAAAPA